MANVNAINLRPDSYMFNLLEIGYNFGMKVGNDEAVFGKVLETEPDVLVPITRYTTLAARTCAASYAGGGASIWNEWVDADGNEIFTEEETDYIIQCHIGLWPAQLRWWFQYPSGQTRGSLSKIRIDEPADMQTPIRLDGSRLNGSPYGNPSRRSEILVPKELDIRHMIYNPTRAAVMPQALVHQRRCLVKWYDKDNSNDMKQIQQFCNYLFNNKGEPVHYWTPGIDGFTYGAKSNLGIPPVRIREVAGVSI